MYIAMAVKVPSKIEKYQMEYIINLIANYCILLRVQLELQIKNTKAKYAPQPEKHTSKKSFLLPEISSLLDKL